MFNPAIELTLQMSYRRRETSDARLANRLPKTKAPAAVSSILAVELSRCAA